MLVPNLFMVLLLLVAFILFAIVFLEVCLYLYCEYRTPLNIGDKVITRSGIKAEIISRIGHSYQISGVHNGRYHSEFINFWELKRI